VVVDVIRRDPLTGGALTPQVVDNLDTDAHPGLDLVEDDPASTGTNGTVVPLATRASLPTPPARDLPDTGTDGQTSAVNRPAFGRGSELTGVWSHVSTEEVSRRAA
jgi:hypothetical protein